MPIIIANASAPRRVRTNPTMAQVDITVTPPGVGSVAGQIIPGEFLFLTAANGVASLATGGAANVNAASCVGISNDAYPLQYGAGITASLPTNDPFGVVYVGVFEDGDHLMNATVGDTLKPYQLVYIGADGRTVQAAASGSSVGFVCPDQRQAGTSIAPITFGTAVVAGSQVYISIKPALSK